MSDADQPAYPDLGIHSDVDFFRLIVLPDMDAFYANPGVRESVHLATALNNLVEWHFHTTEVKTTGLLDKKQRGDALKTRKSRIEKSYPEMITIRELCDTSKHCGLDRRPIGLSEMKIMGGRGGVGGYGVGHGYGGQGAYGSGIAHPRLCVAGTQRYLDEYFVACISYWKKLLGQ